MYNFCTLFDSRYLAKGIAMIDSLAESGIDFRLYFFPFDDKAEKVIKELDYDRVIIIPLRLFEDKDLLKIKQSRSASEYCWTCTPSTILYVLNNFQAGECTYIDADLYFYSSPERIFAEMKDSSILLTEHRYTREYDQTEISGRFCVQFTTFKKDPSGLNALIWWRNACIDWCYSRFEDGKFGDQKYLDDWPGRFPGVHVLEEPGGDLAPWNIQQYILLPDGKRITGRERTSGKEFAVIFYHFHDLKFFPGNLADLGFYRFPPGVIDILYKPYIRKLFEACRLVKSIDSSIDPLGTIIKKPGWKTPFRLIRKLKRLLKGNYNIFNVNKFVKGGSNNYQCY